MRYLCTSQGRRQRMHYVPDDQHVALCGVTPCFTGRWQPKKPNARPCTACHQLHLANQGVDYAKAKAS